MAAILSIEQHTITLADTVASATATLSVGDVTRCTPRISWVTSSTDLFENYLIRPRFLTGPNRIEVGRTATSGEVIVQVTIIEWDTPSGDIDVQTGSITITAATDSSSISNVDLAKTFMTFGYDATAGDNDTVSIRGMLTAIDTISWVRDTATDTIVINWWTVEDTSSGGLFDVQRVQALSIAGTTADATITSVVEARTILIASQHLNNFGDEPDEWGVVHLFNATTVRYVRDDQAGTANADVFVVEFTLASGVSVQRGSIVNGDGVSVGTAAISSVDLTRSMVHCPMIVVGGMTDEANNAPTLVISIEFNSDIEIEANSQDSTSTETTFFEVIEFPAAAVDNQSPVFVGANH